MWRRQGADSTQLSERSTASFLRVALREAMTTSHAGLSSAAPEIIVRVDNEQRRRSSTHTRTVDMRRLAAVEEQRSKVQAACDQLGESDSAMRMDLQLLLDRMDRQIQDIRGQEGTQWKLSCCKECLPCVRPFILWMPNLDSQDPKSRDAHP